MALDIFGRRSASYGDSFSADDALMKFSGIRDANGFRLPATAPLLVQNTRFDYQQQITRLYDLTSNKIYYVAGRSAGQGQIGQVLGPSKLSQAFLHTYGTVCDASEHQLTFEMLSSCDDTDNAESLSQAAWDNSHGFTAMFVVLTAIGLQMGAQDMVIQQTVNMTFASLEYFDTSSRTSGGIPANLQPTLGVGDINVNPAIGELAGQTVF